MLSVPKLRTDQQVAVYVAKVASLNQRLIFINLLASGLVLLICALWLFQTEQTAIYQRHISLLKQFSSSLSLDLLPVVNQQNRLQASLLLRRLDMLEGSVCAALYSAPSGQLLQTQNCHPAEVPETFQLHQYAYRIGDTALHVWWPLSDDLNNKAGLYLRQPVAALQTEVTQYLQQFSMVLLLAWLAIGMLAWLLGQRISQAFDDLQLILGRAEREGNYAVRLHTQEPQVLQSLFQTINNMLAQLQRYDQQLKQTQTELNQRIHQHAYFVTAMTQELRSELQQLQKHLQSAELVDLNQAQRIVAQLSQTTQQVYDFTRLETDRLELEAEDFNPYQLIENCVQQFSAMAQQAGLTLQTHLPINLPDVVRGDSVRLTQILSHLIDNALKFTPQGYILVRASLFKEEQNTLLFGFEIEDTGCGLSREHLKAVFQPFLRLSSNNNKTRQGPGLGLALSKLLVEKMGGKIGAQSVLDTGSTFWFTAYLDKSPLATQRPFNQVLTAPNRTVQALLVAEPPALREVLKYYLQDWGIHSKIIRDINELGLAYPYCMEDSFYVVLIMNRGNSLSSKQSDLLAMLKCQSALVLLIAPQDLRQELNLPQHWFFLKMPFHIEELHQQLKQLLVYRHTEN